ncbi:MAG: hypothetical protein K9N21_07265 [Deltaproteobacteria bacterium]|nr:hypothetical protein [Deltaproteobacteria bacterium]
MDVTKCPKKGILSPEVNPMSILSNPSHARKAPTCPYPVLDRANIYITACIYWLLAFAGITEKEDPSLPPGRSTGIVKHWFCALGIKIAKRCVTMNQPIGKEA